jgi:transposase-like protein
MNNFHEWVCECPDFRHRHVTCKHIHAVLASLNIRQYVSSQTIQKPVEVVETCRFCGSSNFAKEGHRKNRGYKLQRYRCKDCGKWFVINYGFEKMRYDPNAITTCIDLYFKGVSLRNIADHLKQFFGRKPSCSTIHDWLKRYTRLAKEYVDEIAPQTSGFLHVDEMKVNVNGKLDWLWNLMDSDTRFWISSMISQGREIEDARQVFQKAKATVGPAQEPSFIVTDKLQAYRRAFNKEFYVNEKSRPMHVRLKNIRQGTNNNIVERLHGTVRERTKVMRGLDNEESARRIIEGHRIYYNHIRPHMALNGKTPAEVAGLDLHLKGNKWERIIKKAAERLR